MKTTLLKNLSGRIALATLLLLMGLMAPLAMNGQTQNTLLSQNFDGNGFSITDNTYASPGWYTYNAGSGNNWSLYNGGQDYAHSGNYYVRYYYSGTNAANCYLVSEPFSVNANMTQLSVSLFETTGSFTEKFEVFFIKASDVSSNTLIPSTTYQYQAIASDSYNNPNWVETTGSVQSSAISALAGQIVRLVIHCTSDADMFYLNIDDITVTETIPSTTPYITLSPSSATVLTGSTETLTANYGNVSGTPTITYSSNNTSVATVSGSGSTATVTAVAPGTATITATMNGSYTATCAITVEDPSYCTPAFSYTSDYITSFTTTEGEHNISNTNNSQGTGGYTDYYNSHYVSAEPGTTINFSVNGTDDTYYYGLWVDWNKDYEFDNSTEKVASTTSKTRNWSSNFTIPTGTAEGDYHMRVVQSYSSAATPCISGNWGEGEDYKLTVTSASSSYSVTYDANNATSGSVPTDNSSYSSGDVVTVLGNTGNLAKTGLVFSGWNTAADGSGTSYTADNTFNIYSNTTLYAKWTATVTYACNGGTSGCPSNVTGITEGTTITLAAAPSKTGYVFTGWNDGTTTYDAGDSYTVTSNVTFTAQWTAIYTISASASPDAGGTVTVSHTYGFEDGTSKGWTWLDNDGDGGSWFVTDELGETTGGEATVESHGGDYYLRSTFNAGAHAENWLFSPQFSLGGSISFYIKRLENSSYDDYYRVYLSTTGTSISDFSTELTTSAIEPGYDYELKTFDLSSYSGSGYIAIKHFATDNDQAYLFIDDVTIVEGSTSSCTFLQGETCTMTATTNNCYSFDNWTEGGSQASANASYSFEVTGNRTLVANFSNMVDVNDITVEGTTTINSGNTTTLTADGITGATYKWYSDAACTVEVGSGTTLTTPALTETTTYYVKATKNSGDEHAGTAQTFNYYTDNVQSYSIPANASSVKLEVWGAQGGNASTAYNGGAGGYSVGTLSSPSGTLYVCVGGQGTSDDGSYSNAAELSGGYNGGGSGRAWYNTYHNGAGGGGATHIATSSGVLSSFSSNTNPVLLVAGGGGGASDDGNGGCGGGESGTAGTAAAGTQSSGSAFLHAAPSSCTDAECGGGGGGWYGGYGGAAEDASGGGGSGYVKSTLTNASTIAGNASMPNPDGGADITGREGNGYARITPYYQDVCESEAKAVTVTVLSCTAPVVTVSDITPTSATVSWTPSSNAESYTLHYRTAKFSYGFEHATPWAITSEGFAPCSVYDGDGQDTYSLTSPKFPNSYYVGAFIAFQNEYSGSYMSHNGHAFGACFAATESVANNDFFILPAIAIETGDELSFWARNLSSDYNEDFNVGVFNSSTLEFTALTGETFPVTVTSTDWTQYSYDLSAYAGQTIQLAINCVSEDKFALFIDDIYVTTNSWTGTITNATSPYVLEGLNEESDYEVQVETNCGEDGTSQGSQTFSTLPPQYDIVIADVFGGTVTTTPASHAAEGTLVEVDVTPNTGYELASLTVNYACDEGNFEDGFENGVTGWFRKHSTSGGRGWKSSSSNVYAGSKCACSEAYYGSEQHDPDNWLITPRLTLGGQLSFWYRKASSGTDNFAVYVYTGELATNTGEFVKLDVDDISATATYQQYKTELTAYEGMQGYIAIRHYNSSTGQQLYIDNFELIRNIPIDITTYGHFVMPACEATVDAAFRIPECKTQDFEDVTGTVYDAEGNMPTGWFSYTTATGDHIVAPHVCSGSSYNYHSDGSQQSLVMESGTNANNTAYVVLPLYSNVESVSFYAKKESTTYDATLTLGYVDDQTATACNSFTPIVNVSLSTTIGLKEFDFTTDYTLPSGKYLAFRWVSGGTYYAVGLDDIEVCAVDLSYLWTYHVKGEPSGFALDNINSAEDLAWFISYVNGYNGQAKHPNVNAKLTADIDMSGHVWVPIGYGSGTGSDQLKYTGTFDGQYHTISGIHIAEETEAETVNAGHGDMRYTGLFGYLDGSAVVKNVILTDSRLCNGYSEGDNKGFLGGIAGYANSANARIEMCESAVTLTALDDIAAIGGVAGAANNVVACMSMSNIYYGSHTMESAAAGVVGHNLGDIKDCFANSTLVGAGTSPKPAAVVGQSTRTKNIYAHPGASGAEKVVFNGSTAKAFAPASATQSYSSSSYEATYTPVNYTYGQPNNLVTDSDSLLVDTLNQRVSNNFKWIMPHKTHINGGYPIVVRTNDADGLMAVVGISGDKKVYYGEANAMITKYGSNGDADIYVYGGGLIAPPASALSARLFIDENASIKQTTSGTITATVGVTMDNSKGTNDGDMLLGRDWHCFATPLNEPVLGITYTNNNQLGSSATITETTESVTGTYDINTVSNSYLACLNDNADDDLDYYDFYEPQYHWINLKRNKNSHWHQDNGEQIVYDQGSVMKSGKGYLIAVGNNTAAKRNVYLSATGTLKDGNVDVTVTNSGAHLAGYNLLGNPYQSYLDFNRFIDATEYDDEDEDEAAVATANNEALWTEGGVIGYRSYLIYDADEGRFAEYLVDKYNNSFSQNAATNAGRYIHPHQAFFVVKNTTTTDNTATVTFTNAMRSTTGWQSNFRDAQPNYPLVNLFCTDEDGKKEVSIIEVERPAMSGALKMMNMMNGKANMYIRWNNEDFSSMFIEGTPEYVPVWFKSIEEGVFTMSWSTANDNFGYLHLIDNLTGNDIDMLAAESYAFQSKPSDSKARFRLVFKPLGIDEETTSEQGENFAFINGNELVVTGEGELSLIDLNGRVLATEYVSGQQSHIAMPKVAVGMYMLRLTNGKETKVQKIVIRK